MATETTAEQRARVHQALARLARVLLTKIKQGLALPAQEPVKARARVQARLVMPEQALQVELQELVQAAQRETTAKAAKKQS